jgi:hypothetical protein
MLCLTHPIRDQYGAIDHQLWLSQAAKYLHCHSPRLSDSITEPRPGCVNAKRIVKIFTAQTGHVSGLARHTRQNDQFDVDNDEQKTIKSE